MHVCAVADYSVYSMFRVSFSKGKVNAFIKHLYYRLSLKVLRYGSHSFTCKLHHVCLYLVSIHLMALPLIVAADT